MAENPILLAVDAGTGSIRATLFDLSGQMVGQAKRAFSIDIGAGHTAEFALPEVWTATRDVIREVTANGAAIAGVGVTGAVSLVAAGKHAQPLRPAIMWQDRRATAEGAALQMQFGEVAIYQTAGRQVDPENSACKILWMKTHEPAIWERAEIFYSAKDWLIDRMTGARVTDPVTASYTLLYDVPTRQWNDAILREVGLTLDRLPCVTGAGLVAGHLLPDVAREMGLPSGIPVVVGGPDGSMGALGSGMAAPGMAVDVIGTTDVCLACIDRPIHDLKRRIVLNAYVVPGTWAVGGPLGLTGGAVRWFIDTFGGTDANQTNRFAALDAQAAAIAPGADGLMFLPGLSGDRIPHWNPRARGVLFGVAPRHERAHAYRALLEGCAFAVRETFNAITDIGVNVDEVRVAGGGATSQLWLGIRAAVLGRQLKVPEVLEASSLGTAMAVAVGIGLHRDLPEAARHMVRIARTVSADPVAAAKYERQAQLYHLLRTQLTPVFDQAERLRLADS